MRKFFSLFAAMTLCLPMLQGAIKVHTIGDSTMAEYDESTTDKRGWGMYLGSFFDPSFVTVNNRGKSGADTRGFYTGAAYWPSVKSQMSAGDYLLIQFAHNDEGNDSNLAGLDNLEYAAYCKEKGLPAPTDARGTNPQTTYRDFLRLFIDEARELGVSPVLVGPICRAYFSGNNITRKGQHDLGDKFAKIENGEVLKNQSVPASDLSMSYVEAMRIVAAEKNVPFIDLTEATRQLYLSYGESQCLSLLFCSGDKTHTNAMGGNLVARAAAQLLKNAGVLAEHIDIPTDITANPASINIGETYCSVPQNKEFLLTGYGLEPTAGTVNLSASANLLISLDKENYASSAQVSYEGGSMFQKVFIRANYATGGLHFDTVYATSGEHKVAVPVSAMAIALDGGADVSAFWAIGAKPVPAPVVEGPISAEFTMSQMACIDYNAAKNYFVDGDETNIILARFHNSADGSSRTPWPAGEIDENASRYLDFAITAPAAMDVRITRIAMEIASDGTSTMCYHLNTGFGDEFTGVTTIYEKRNMTSRVIEHVDLTPTLTIPAGEVLHVRILPWHDYGEVKDSKYIGLRNVRIEGMAFESGEEGIEEVQNKVQSTKVLRNGQIIILRNGVEYTPAGQIVK
jgi:lysophospholipase L1-like esterase